MTPHQYYMLLAPLWIIAGCIRHGSFIAIIYYAMGAMIATFALFSLIISLKDNKPRL